MRSMERLVGMRLPSLRLSTSTGDEVDLSQLTEDRIVVYLYPGDDPPAEPRSPQPSSCAVQRAGFREYALDFAAQGARIAGLSNERQQLQLGIAEEERLPFALISDRDCALADTLQLPTFHDLGARRYRRLTLICERGAVLGALYPVSPKRSARQALDWLESRDRR
jgi:peroxiredoxin